MLLSPFGIRVAQHNPIGTQYVRILQTPAPKIPVEPGFQEALAALVGPDCPGLSANTITRLKSICQEEYEVWSKRSLVGHEYVFVWADGFYSNVRLEDDRVCLLALIGVTKEGRKELVAVWDGTRESELSWLEVHHDLKRRGLTIAPKLAIGDRASGFWAALRKEWPSTRKQRC